MSSNDNKKSKEGKQYITTFSLAMLNIIIIAGLGNDPQQAFYGLSSVTYYLIGFILFFIPTALVSAELASGWPQRGGIFRWVGEGIGTFWAFLCLMILWFQDTMNTGEGMPSFAATIMFYTPEYKKALVFVNNPKHELLIMCGFLVLYWICTWLATKGVKFFAALTKYGVLIGTFIPLAVMIILLFVWLAEGHKPAISMAPKNLIPQWNGMGTLALAAGVLFAWAGIDMNSAYIRNLKHPTKQYTMSIIIAGLGAFIIFVVGTLIIAMVIPEKQLNVVTALYVLFHDLGATIGAPWLYLVFVYAGFISLVASWVTNIAAPSIMLGQAGQCGLLPHWLQNYNKHGMPSKMMYFGAVCVTLIAFMVKEIPNIEGFIVMMTQAVTILYLIYYIVMFVAFIRLRYTQPDRPRGFKIGGGWFGAWLVTIVGIVSCVFGIVLGVYPPAQISQEVGSPAVYVWTIIGLTVAVIVISIGVYIWCVHYNKQHNNSLVNPHNDFAPFTWQIEGMKKPQKTLSNVPTVFLSYGQNPLGMPIKYPVKPNLQIVVPKDYKDEDRESFYADELHETGTIKAGWKSNQKVNKD